MRLRSLCVGVGSGLLAAVVGAAPQQRPTFRSTANGVLVNAYVLAVSPTSAKAVDGLTSADFVLTDNGETEPVEAAPARGPIDLTLVVDVSQNAALAAPQFRQIVQRLVGGLTTTDRVRLLVCGPVVREVRPLLPVSAPLIDTAIGASETPYGPSIMHGLFDAMIPAADPDRRQVVVSLTTLADRDIFGPRALMPVVAASDAVLYVVTAPMSGLYPGTVPDVGQLVSATGGALLVGGFVGGRSVGAARGRQGRPSNAYGGALVIGFQSFKDVSSIVLNDLRHGYVLSYSPPHGVTPGWHDIQVRMRNPFLSYVVRARKRYFASNGS